MTKPIKHDFSFNEAMEKAEQDFRTYDGKEMAQKCPYLFSSDFADAYWITAFSLYHSGRRPAALKRSRVNSWLVDLPGNGIVRAHVDKPDQRDGVRIVAV